MTRACQSTKASQSPHVQQRCPRMRYPPSPAAEPLGETADELRPAQPQVRDAALAGMPPRQRPVLYCGLVKPVGGMVVACLENLPPSGIGAPHPEGAGVTGVRRRRRTRVFSAEQRSTESRALATPISVTSEHT